MVEPLIAVVEEGAGGTILLWDAVSGALSYSVVRGTVGTINVTPDFIDLGSVDCIAVTIQPDTIGFDDPDLPPPGGAFIYLVEYNDGLPSGFGTVSAPKGRVVPPGSSGCP